MESSKVIDGILKHSTHLYGKPEFTLPNIKTFSSEKLEEEKVFQVGMTGDGHLHPKEAQGLVTDIVIDEFLKDHDKMFNFMSIICILYNKCIDKYCDEKGFKKTRYDESINSYVFGDIFFIYKGGNVLRLLFNEFRKNLSSKISSYARDNFAKYFKKSDSDFSIFVNPELENYDMVYDDLVRLSYCIQKMIRDKLFNKVPKGNNYDVFSYLEFNDTKKEMVLSKLFSDFKEMSSLKDENNTLFYGAQIQSIKLYNDKYDDNGYYTNDGEMAGKKDLIIDVLDRTMNDGTKIMGTYPISDHKKIFPISVNYGLDFIKGTEEEERRTKFALVRTKLNLEVRYEKEGENCFKNIGGELIDVTIMHRDSFELTDGKGFEGIKEKITKYNLYHNNQSISFFSYNLKGLIYDLERILFIDTDKPWSDLKYKKRINRLFFLYMIDLFENVKTIEKRLDVISSFEKEIINTLSNMALENKLQEVSLNIGSNFGSDYALTNIIKYLVQISKICTADDMEDYNCMLEIIRENTKHINHIFKEMIDYVRSEAEYSGEDNNNMDMESL